MMKREIKIAAISVATVDGLVDSNYSRALRLSEIAAAMKPDIVLLPEAFAAGYCDTNLLPYAESKDSVYLQRFRELSQRGQCMIVVGFIENAEDGLKNAAIIFDRGAEIGTHHKRDLWPDAKKAYRDEASFMIPGKELEVFDTRLGRFSVLICYENVLEKDWREVSSQVDFVLSVYNCTGDPSHNNLKYSKSFRVPSAWADRTGTVWAGDRYEPNMGTAGMLDSKGAVIARSEPGVEQIIVGVIDLVP